MKKYNLKYKTIGLLFIVVFYFIFVRLTNSFIPTQGEIGISNENTPDKIVAIPKSIESKSKFNIKNNSYSKNKFTTTIIKRTTPSYKSLKSRPLIKKITINYIDFSELSNISYNTINSKHYISFQIKNLDRSEPIDLNYINYKIYKYDVFHNPYTNQSNLPFFEINTKDINNAIKQLPFLSEYNIISNSNIKHIYKLGFNLIKNTIRNQNKPSIHTPISTFNSRNLKDSYRITVGWVFKFNSSSKKNKFKKEFRIFEVMYKN